MRPAQRSGGSGDPGGGADTLGQRSGRGRGAAQVGHQPARRGSVSERRQPPGRPGGRGAPRVRAGPIGGGLDPEAPASGEHRPQRAVYQPGEGGPRERLCGPGGGGVDSRGGIARRGGPAPRWSRRASATSPPGGPPRSRCPGSRRPPRPARRNRPWTVQGRRRRSGRAARRRGPPPGPSRPRPPAPPGRADRASVVMEARRGAEIERGQEVGDPPGLAPVPGAGEGDRRGGRIARPDVCPAVANPGRHRPAAAIGEGAQDEQRALPHAHRPGGSAGRQRAPAGQPAPVGADGRGDQRPGRARRPGGAWVADDAPVEASPPLPLESRRRRPGEFRGRRAALAGAPQVEAQNQPQRLAAGPADLDPAGQRSVPGGVGQGDPRPPQPRDRAEDVGARQVALADPARPPEGPRGAAARGDPDDDPGVRGNAPGGLALGGVGDQRPPRRSRARAGRRRRRRRRWRR